MKTVLLLLITNFSLPIADAQWVQVSNGIGTGIVVNCLAVSGNNIFAGTNAYGVYKSADYGQSWTQTSLNNKSVLSFAVSGNTIRAGLDNLNNTPSVFISTDNGGTWDTNGLNYNRVYCLAMPGNNIIAGTLYGVYLSTNNGGSWTPTNLNNNSPQCFGLSGNNVFAGCGGGAGIWRSTDNGANWIQWYNPPSSVVRSFAVSGNNIYAGFHYFTNQNGGVYLSTNGGDNWTQTTLTNCTVYSLAVSANNVFAGTDGTNANGVYVSTNNGGNWNPRNEGLPSPVPGIRSLILVNNYIFAGTNGYSVWRRPLSELVGIQPISSEIPKQFSLVQNYPNPFNPTTVIKFQVASSSGAKLVVYDVLGREVATLVNEELQAGTYEVNWDATNYPSGVYYYKLTVGDASTPLSMTETKRMVLIK